MSERKVAQKFISFVKGSEEFNQVKKDMELGWNIINLINSGQYYIGIMEKNDNKSSDNKDIVFIPPKKKIKITSKGK